MSIKVKRTVLLILAMMVCVSMMPLQYSLAEEGGAASSETKSINEYLGNVAEVADITNNSADPFTVVDQEDGSRALLSGKPTSNNASSTLTLEFTKAATVSFDYKLDCGTSTRVGLEVKKESATLYTYSSYGSGETGINGSKTGKTETASFDANAGETVTISYSHGYVYSSDNVGNNCMYLSNFKVTLPKQVTFHANNGTEDTSQQGVFGTGNLEKNRFTYDGHIFKGWSDTTDGEIKYEDGAEITLEDNTDLYAVWAPVYKVTLDPDPSDAEVNLYGDSDFTNKISPDKYGGHDYTLEAGTYYWKGSMFGYADGNGEVIVSDKDVTVKAELKKNASTKVTFKYTGQEAASIKDGKLSVWTGDGYNKKEIKAEEDSNGLIFDLPQGYKWNYKFSSKNYSGESGEIDLTSDTTESKTVEIPLKEKTAWEGSDDVEEPATDKEGVYQIGTGAELAWFANKVNDGSGSINAVLTKDIDLGNQEWTPIGKTSGYYSTNSFKGTFDGNGKTIKGLKVDSTTYNQGLFGILGEKGCVKDLTVEGSVKGGTSNSGGVGGIIGTAAGYSGSNATVKNCVSKVTVEGGNNVGGIVGLFKYTDIENCVNYGKISGNNNIGGIVGQMYNRGTVKTSYNRGEINASVSKAGGIAGYMDDSGASVSDCYVTGTVSGKQDVNPVIGKKDRGSANNLYYLDTLGTDSNAAGISDADLKQLKFKSPIEAFVKDMADPVNDGYPILSFQDTTPKYKTKVTVNDVDAKEVSIVLSGEDGTKYNGTSDGNGTWTYDLPDGKYDYEIKAFGKETQKGSITVSGKETAVTVVMKDSERGTISFDITYSDGSKDVTPEIILKTGDRTMEAEKDGSYIVPYGEYEYVIKAKKYKKIEGTVKVDKGSIAIPVEMEYTESWDGESISNENDIKGDGTEASPYQITSGEDLAWIKQITAGIYASSYQGKYYKLMNDVDLGNNEWTPIGISTSKPFIGNFDGNGKKVTGLSITKDNNNSSQAVGLFGAVGKASSSYGGTYPQSSVKDLTVQGTVTTKCTKTGGIIGYAENAELSGLKNDVNVTYAGTSSSDGTGGVIGYAKCNKITECVNTGNISGTNKVGGVAGSMSASDGEMKHVYNTGKVKGGSQVGGIAGYLGNAGNFGYNIGIVTVGETDKNNCFGSVASSYSDKVNNFYYVGENDDSVKTETGITKEELKAKTAEFNGDKADTWIASSEAFNQGYPIFTWQKAESDAVQKTADEEKALKEAKDKAKADLAAYKDAKDYRDAQQAELSNAIEAGNAAIDKSADKDAVNAALAEAKANIDKIKTDAQLTEEEKAAAAKELAQAKEDAKAELDKIDKSKYRKAEQKSLNEEIEQAKKAIDAAKDKAAVNKALEDAKAEIGKIKTDAELTAAEKAARDKAIAAKIAKAKKLKVKKFKIKAKKGVKTVHFTWKKTKGASGYQIQYRISKKGTKYKTLKNTRKLKCSTSKLKKNRKYKVRIRAYQKIQGKKVYGKWNTKNLKKRAR